MQNYANKCFQYIFVSTLPVSIFVAFASVVCKSCTSDTLFYHTSHFSLFPIFGHTVHPDVYFATQTTNIFL